MKPQAKPVEVYPRIVTNGKYYRIEIGPEKYDKIREDWAYGCTWDTRWLWLARLRLRGILRDDAYYESIKPDRWKPVTQKHLTK